MNTWRPIPSLDNRWEVCLETKQVRNTLTKKLNTLYMRGDTPTLKTKYRPKGASRYSEAKPVQRSVYKLLDEVFPYWWIEKLEEDEEVRPIKGFPDYYISTYGRVYSTRYNSSGWKALHYKAPYYYKTSIFREDGKQVSTFSHILVGRNFLPEWREGLHILHKDETLPYPQINHPSNLWVGTQADNNRDMWSKGRGVGRGQPKLHIIT